MSSSLVIPDLIRLAKLANYDYLNKENYRKAALRYLRSLAAKLGLVKGTFDVRFNPGGIAVAGDAILHHDSFYLHINEGGSFWRTCNGLKDYTGGPNQWVHGFGGRLTERELCEAIDRVLLKPLKAIDRNEIQKREADERGAAFLMAD